MQRKKINSEVLYARGPVVKTDRLDVAALKRGAGAAARKRMRLCAHPDVRDKVHEMLIVLKKGVYIRPHKHLGKSESFHVIEGRADIFVFTGEGKIREKIPMGDYSSGRKFFYRISAPFYHTLLVRSAFFAFHETTTGPFRKAGTTAAPWAPDESDAAAAGKFMKRLARLGAFE